LLLKVRYAGLGLPPSIQNEPALKFAQPFRQSAKRIAAKERAIPLGYFVTPFMMVPQQSVLTVASVGSHAEKTISLILSVSIKSAIRVS
jgi:isocitrate/isopropylmalate dehydrogenase